MGRFLFYEISGMSMLPSCRLQDKLLIKKVPPEALIFGDIVVYRTRGKMVCHRLLRKIRDNNKYVLHIRGDSSLSLGELISEENFLGKAVAIVRNKRIVSLLGARQRLAGCFMALISPVFIPFILFKRCLNLQKKN